MGLPKKAVLNPYSNKSGIERQEELINMISDKSIFFPKGISLDDLDIAMMDFAQQELKIVIENDVPPTFFMTKERWADFISTKTIQDEHGAVTMPFNTLKRDGAPQPGSNDSIKYTVSQNRKFEYTRVPSFEDGKFSVNIYQIPQPTPVDVTYEFRFYTHFMSDLNKFNEKILYKFASGQAYVMVKGYYMPIMLEDSDLDIDLDYGSHNFYTQPVRLKLIGFLQDIDTFEIVRSVRGINLTVDMVYDYIKK